ncbi:hypothetical protein [Truepera radiovictrix]|uniref:Uncharacterized protein n=1 Tax=Truepera radiovictrix (strain DSM 17093 / CIP 108686 / LMG 22925 / RQ-24) TaxID=649638 RepID=D7CSJ2_TRURR|nr:hypothetical protein [Truepera radiovictrix]ADI15412.1 hypothetical protein Trad_2302 [Truepera radiovictrix DSM 17093]WMT56037.1 hypothetical protein RCV51_08425 [Truepera radiovictrix]
MALTAHVKFADVHDGGLLTLWTRDADDPRPTFADETSSYAPSGALEVYRDDESEAFVGLWHDQPTRFLEDYAFLRALELPAVDCPEAGLRGAHPADVMLWGLRHLAPRPTQAA